MKTSPHKPHVFLHNLYADSVALQISIVNFSVLQVLSTSTHVVDDVKILCDDVLGIVGSGASVGSVIALFRQPHDR